MGLRRYYERYLPIALSGKTGVLLESLTWRASKDWGEKLGYSSIEYRKPIRTLSV